MKNRFPLSAGEPLVIIFFNMGTDGVKRILEKHAGLEHEIIKEIAEALGNAGLRLEDALERVRDCEASIEGLVEKLDGLEEGSARRELEARIREEVSRFNELRREALRRLKYLIIHREAVGFCNHKLVLEKYPIPPPKDPPF